MKTIYYNSEGKPYERFRYDTIAGLRYGYRRIDKDDPKRIMARGEDITALPVPRNGYYAIVDEDANPLSDQYFDKRRYPEA